MSNVEFSANDFDKDAWKAEQKKARDDAFAVADAKAEQLFSYGDDPTAIKTVLDIMSRFRKLTVINALLVYGRKPDATEIGPASYWQKERAARFKAGSKGFILLERGEDYKKNDGSVGHYYKPVKYFDISQTNLKPTKEQKNSSVHPELLRQALRNISSVPIIAKNNNFDLPDSVAGLYYPEQSVIVMRNGLMSNEFFMVLAAQVALSKLDRGGTFFVPDHAFDAACIAYLVCSKWNVATNEFTFPRVPEQYSELDSNDIKNKLYTIKRVADEMSKGIYKYLQKALDDTKELEKNTPVNRVHNVSTSTMEEKYV